MQYKPHLLNTQASDLTHFMFGRCVQHWSTTWRLGMGLGGGGAWGGLDSGILSWQQDIASSRKEKRLKNTKE